MKHFSFRRLLAVLQKEFIQMRRDRLTFAMIIGIPIMQLLLFGFAINSNPKNLPTVILDSSHSQYSRIFTQALQNSHYFKVNREVNTEQQANELMQAGKISFIVRIPTDFSERFIKSQDAKILITADGTDPTAIGNALGAASHIAANVYNQYLQGGLAHLQSQPGPVQLIIHKKYNPTDITQLNIVPGLIGVILTMTMVIITSLSITRENERGTMETLLATPLRPLEVMLGKIIPYVLVAYIQMLLTILFAVLLFNVPIKGSVSVLLGCALPFIMANLGVGLTFSTIAKNQLQAMQMAFFFFLPSILLSGFMFPFAGMPSWARGIGEVLPLTHFIRIARGVMLKGVGFINVAHELVPLLIFLFVVLTIGVLRYRQTLD